MGVFGSSGQVHRHIKKLRLLFRYPLSHLYGHFGLVRLSRLGHDVSWTKA